MLATMRSIFSTVLLASFVLGCGSSPSSQATAPKLAQPTQVQAEPDAVAQKPTPGREVSVVPTGKFGGVHIAIESCDAPDGCETEQTDTIQISLGQSGDDSSLDVNLELYQDFGHGCSFEGTLTKIDDTHWSGKHTGEDEDALACTIVLSLFENSVDINSNDCLGFCGARAHMDASFSTLPASVPPKP